MRLCHSLGIVFCFVGLSVAAFAEPPSPATKGGQDQTPKQVQVNAEQSLEWYQETRLYVARGNAKAVRGNMTVTADTLTAHEREKQAGAPKPKPAAGDKNSEAGDIDLMTAEGNVVIVDPRQRITGDHAIYDLDKHQMVVTGKNLRYETAKEVVTAKDSLEYYEDTKMAVARGHAVADQPTRHIEGDVLTAEFRDAPNGQSQLTKMTSQGHVIVITKKTGDADDSNAKGDSGVKASPTTKSGTKGNAPKGGDVSRGDHAVYDAGSNVAVLTGNVNVTRGDGTQLRGNVAEVNFNNNQSRLMNDGNSRVQALLPPKTTEQATGTTPTAAPQPSAQPPSQPAATP